VVSYASWYASASKQPSAYRQLLHDVFGADQDVGQQGFSTRQQILDMAAAIGARPGARIVDVCSGSSGPAACIASTLECTVIATDRSPSAFHGAHEHAPPSLHAVVGDALRLPFTGESFDGALVLDSFTSLHEPARVLGEVARVLRPGGGLAFSTEAGPALLPAERRKFRRSEVPSIMATAEWMRLLRRAGFAAVRLNDRTRSAVVIARRLADRLAAAGPELKAELGEQAVDDLAATLAAWAELLECGRVSEVAVVAERRHARDVAGPHEPAALSLA
jgi:ubiquinone/menaquinone biosynthesis C-methylase UbiE